MSIEETFATVRRLPTNERAQLLKKIEEWLEETVAAQTADVKRALSAIEGTWATIPLASETLRWVAESKELEYDLR